MVMNFEGFCGKSNDKNHTYDGRLALSKQYSNLCKLIASQGVIVVIATISLFHDIHEWNRKNLPDYFEVYLKVPIEELQNVTQKEYINHWMKES